MEKKSVRFCETDLRKTVRFETKELQRLAKLTRPERKMPSISTMVLMGLLAGLGIAIILRLSLGR
jgi:hypothetical protein